jgi:hypothetical protein
VLARVLLLLVTVSGGNNSFCYNFYLLIIIVIINIKNVGPRCLVVVAHSANLNHVWIE